MLLLFIAHITLHEDTQTKCGERETSCHGFIS